MWEDLWGIILLAHELCHCGVKTASRRESGVTKSKQRLGLDKGKIQTPCAGAWAESSSTTNIRTSSSSTEVQIPRVRLKFNMVER